VDKIGNNVVAEIQRHEIEKRQIHRIVRKPGPGRFIKSAVNKPELGNGQVMNERIAGNGRRDRQKKFSQDEKKNKGKENKLNKTFLFYRQVLHSGQAILFAASASIITALNIQKENQ